MKAILEFNLPEDQEEYDMINNASKMYLSLWDIKQMLRSKLKYNPDGLNDEQLTQWEIMQGEFFEILDNHNFQIH